VEPVRLILRVALAASAIGLILELALPASSRFIDAAAALCVLSTWIVPLLILAHSAYRPPRTSPGSVGVTISSFAAAASFSVAGLALVLVNWIFAAGGDWTRFTLLATAAFWLACVALVAVASRSARRTRDDKPP
jgi:hypothetical protein